jgi:hypothetical protein
MPRPPQVGLRGAEAAEDVSSAADAEQAVRAVPRVELVAELFWQRDVFAQQLRREQSLEEVVVPTVATASREAEHARQGVRLEQRTHGFVGIPNQSVVLPRSRSKSRDDSGPSARIRSSTRSATSWFSAITRGGVGRNCARNQGNSLARTKESPFVCLEDLAPLVELVAPRAVVAGDARVQHEIVRAAGDIDRVELDRS